MGYSGTWGKLIYEKTWSKISRGTVPLKLFVLIQAASFVGKKKIVWFKKNFGGGKKWMVQFSIEEQCQ